VHVQNIDLGLGRGLDDAVYISLSEKDEFGTVPIILFYHGGGYVIGSPGMYINAQSVWLRNMYENYEINCAILSINYPLAPEVKYPHNLNFAYEAYETLIKSKKICPSDIIISGDSAGGCMAYMVSKYAHELRLKENKKKPSIAGLLLISPWVNQSCESDSHLQYLNTDYIAGHEIQGDYTKAYVGSHDKYDPFLDPCISPIHENDFSFLPPVMITIGTREVFHDDIRLFTKKIQTHQRSVLISEGKDLPHISSFMAFV